VNIFYAVRHLILCTGLVRVDESEVFGWSWSFCPTPDVQLDHFLHHPPKLGIPFEMVQFLLKLLLKQRFLAVHLNFHWFKQPNFMPFMFRDWESESWSRIFYLWFCNPGISTSRVHSYKVATTTLREQQSAT